MLKNERETISLSSSYIFDKDVFEKDAFDT